MPFKAVVTIESFPKTTVLEPNPLALYPITIWLVCPFPKAFEVSPKNIEETALVKLDTPSANNCPALIPMATFRLPVAKLYNAL